MNKPTLNESDMEFVQTRKYPREEIFTQFKVPPIIGEVEISMQDRPAKVAARNAVAEFFVLLAAFIKVHLQLLYSLLKNKVLRFRLGEPLFGQLKPVAECAAHETRKPIKDFPVHAADSSKAKK